MNVKIIKNLVRFLSTFHHLSKMFLIGMKQNMQKWKINSTLLFVIGGDWHLQWLSCVLSIQLSSWQIKSSLLDMLHLLIRTCTVNVTSTFSDSAYCQRSSVHLLNTVKKKSRKFRLIPLICTIISISSFLCSNVVTMPLATITYHNSCF